MPRVRATNQSESVGSANQSDYWLVLNYSPRSTEFNYMYETKPTWARPLTMPSELKLSNSSSTTSSLVNLSFQLGHFGQSLFRRKVMDDGKMRPPNPLPIKDFSAQIAGVFHFLMHFLLVFTQEIGSGENLIAKFAREALFLVDKIHVKLQRSPILIYFIALIARKMTLVFVVNTAGAAVVTIIGIHGAGAVVIIFVVFVIFVIFAFAPAAFSVAGIMMAGRG